MGTVLGEVERYAALVWKDSGVVNDVAQLEISGHLEAVMVRAAVDRGQDTAGTTRQHLASVELPSTQQPSPN